MTIEEVQNLVQKMFDNIFDSVTKAGADGNKVMQSSSTVLSLMKPGLAINSKDFRNPWTPGNLTGSQDAAANVAALVDKAPKMSTIYTDNGNLISKVYEQILDGVNLPVQPPNPVIEKQLSDADAVIHRRVITIDSETGLPNPEKIMLDTQLYQDYDTYRTAYNSALTAYNSAYFIAQTTAVGRNTWPLVASTYQLPVKTAYNRWRSAGADKVEQAIAIISTSNQNALQTAWNNAKTLYNSYKTTLDATETARSSLLPSDWHSSNSKAGWTSFKSTSDSVANSTTSDYKSYGGSAGFSRGLFTVGASGNSTSQDIKVGSETNGLQVSFSYTLVTIRRPWMTFNLLGTQGWDISNLYKKGAISNGSKDGQDNAVMPLLPTSFVVVKDVQIFANWSKSDLELIKQQISARGSLGIGPFSISGQYASSKSKETFTSEMASGKITVPGVQIIGFISQIVPYSSPA